MTSAAEAAAAAAMAWTMGGGTEEIDAGDGPLMLGDGDDADDAEGKAAAGGRTGA